MGLKFRRSVKIAPGLRLNLGKRGMSLSAGVRGARVTIGNGRVTKTIGLPGTGISHTSSQRLGSSREITPKRARQLQLAAQADFEIQRELMAYGSFLGIANNSEPMKTSADFNHELNPREFEPSIYGLQVRSRWFYIKSYVKKSTKWFGIAAAILFFLGLFSNNVNFQKGMTFAAALSFCAFFLQVPALFIYGIFKSGKLARENNRQISEAREGHPSEETKRIDHCKEIFAGKTDVIESEIEAAISQFAEYVESLPHKFDLNVSFEFNEPDTVCLNTDLPEIENVVMTETKKALKTGEVSVKEKKEKDINREYAVGVLGIAFNLATRVFNTSPCIRYVVVSGYTQRLDRSTGKNRDHYVYKIKFERNKMADLNLHGIDPVESVENFDNTISMTKTFYLEEVILREPA